ncbi:MAG: hypothetical protein EAX96_00445 [Candidatus Lokiarchaeota archaeon]|nr:hypothetical protein [Candidatus Lokiarchaeota archaeon]
MEHTRNNKEFICAKNILKVKKMESTIKGIEKNPIKDEDLDYNFKYEIAKYREGNTIFNCYLCGTCSSGCPIAEVADFAPHQIIHMSLIGMKDQVLKSETLNSIWLCSTCYNCLERCPQSVKVTEILFILKNMAVETIGKIPKGIKMLSEMMISEGRTAEITDMQEDERDELELPPAPKINIEPIKKILDKIEISKKIGGEK